MERYSQDFVKDIIEATVSKLNIKKNITPHTFRRTRATHLLNAGVNIIYIQELLGHESITTTEDYAKIITKTKFDAIKKVTPDYVSEENYKDWNNDKKLLDQLLNL